MNENIKRAFLTQTAQGYTVNVIDLEDNEWEVFDFGHEDELEALQTTNELNISGYLEGADIIEVSAE
jgi:hypothetical protein